MPKSDSRVDEFELARLRELIALAKNCSTMDEISRGALGAAIEKLASHAWSNEEHGVIFASLRAVGSLSLGRLREELAAQATRFGHPEVDWDDYFV